MKPLQYNVYKGMGGKNGAIQFKISDPHYRNGAQRSCTGKQPDGESIFDNGWKLKEGWEEEEGCLFIDITSTKEGQKNIYDWDKKVTLALSVTELGTILLTLATGEECSITHDPGAQTERKGQVQKYLKVFSPQGTSKGVMIQVTQVNGDEKRSHIVPLNGAEVMTLRSLLQAAIPRLLGW